VEDEPIVGGHVESESKAYPPSKVWILFKKLWSSSFSYSFYSL